MVSGAGEWPVKATSPALGVCASIAPATECLRLPRLRVLNKKAYADLSQVLEIARVRCQCLRL